MLQDSLSEARQRIGCGREVAVVWLQLPMELPEAEIEVARQRVHRATITDDLAIVGRVLLKAQRSKQMLLYGVDDRGGEPISEGDHLQSLVVREVFADHLGEDILGIVTSGHDGDATRGGL